MLEVSSVMFAYAIGLRKISLFINIARWFVTIEKFKDMQTLSQYKSLQNSKHVEQNSNTFLITLTCLFVTIFMHVILLLSVFFYNTDFILGILTFVHYYPMSIVIILCFIWIFVGLNRFIRHQMSNPKTPEHEQ
jgi:phosphoglycerol transferase MdoB-like AlkP superfamily enzyme